MYKIEPAKADRTGLFTGPVECLWLVLMGKPSDDAVVSVLFRIEWAENRWTYPSEGEKIFHQSVHSGSWKDPERNCSSHDSQVSKQDLGRSKKKSWKCVKSWHLRVCNDTEILDPLRRNEDRFFFVNQS